MVKIARHSKAPAALDTYQISRDCIWYFRLGQLIVEYDPPLKKLSEEFVPHSRVLTRALMSLGSIYPRRNLSAEQWRSAQMLSLVSNPNQLLNPAHTETIPCEYLSLVTMERWIIFGFAICHQTLTQDQVANELWTLALSSGWVIPLFRDEVLYIHNYVQVYFESIKGYGKKVNEIKECYSNSIQNSCTIHRERRKFLRSAMRELVLLCADQPGLLGKYLAIL